MVVSLFTAVPITASAATTTETYTFNRDIDEPYYVYLVYKGQKIRIQGNDGNPNYRKDATIVCGDVTVNIKTPSLILSIIKDNYVYMSSVYANYIFNFSSSTKYITHVKLYCTKNNYEGDNDTKSFDTGTLKYNDYGQFYKVELTLSYTKPFKTYNINYELNGGINAAGNPATYDDDKSVTLLAPTQAGYIFGGWYDNEGLNGDPVTTIPEGSSGDKTFYAKWISENDLAKNGNTYTIKSTTGWESFCDLLADNAKGYFDGKTVLLDDDISVTRMAGGSYHDMTGIFDGQGHTLTVSYGTHGGFVGNIGNNVNAKLTVEGCAFDGKILSVGETATGNCSGFVGYKGGNGKLTITNSICAPADLETGETEASSGSATFSRNGSTGENCYYTRAFGSTENQGKQAYSITAGENVTLALSGEATEYDVSGITAYADNKGLKYGDTIYAGNEDSITLALGHDKPTGYTFNGYTASAGTLNDNTLTMPDENVVITADDTINKYTVTLPDKLEIVSGTVTDGKADYGTEIKFKVKDGYTQAMYRQTALT